VANKVKVFAFVVFALLVFGTTAAFAGDDWQPILPEDLKVANEPKAPGASAIYLYRQVDRDDQAGHEVNYARIKILTEDGRKNADVELPFNKDRGAIRGIKARTIHADGSIAEFDGKVYDKTIVKTKGVRIFAKTFTLPDVQVGSIIEYRYVYDWESSLIYDSNWTLSEELFTKRAKFSLKPSPDYAVRWSWTNLPAGTVPPKNTNGSISLDVQDIPPFPNEDYMPPEGELKARVNFVYTEGLEKDAEKFWKEYAKKKNSAIESYSSKRKAMDQAVSGIVAPGDAPEVELEKIYAGVQQIRNLSFESQKTGQEQKREKFKDLNNVEDIWKAGYSYGSGLNWLFLALARSAGFEAYPVFASARSDHFFHPALMNSFELNTTVVLVKVNGKDVFCDPATRFAPFGILPWEETGISGRRLDKDGGAWVETPMPESSASRIERKADLKLTDEGSLEGKLIVTYSGLTALWRRLDERQEDDAERKKFLEDGVKEYIPVGAEVELTNKPDWNSSSPTLVAEFKITVQGWASAAGHRTVLAAELFGNEEKHTFEHANRVHPIYFQYPFEEVDDVNIDLPLGWQVQNVPAEKTKDAKVVSYSLKAENKKNAVHVSRNFKVDIQLLDPKFYPALRSFYELVRTGDEDQIVLQPIS
jgi:uncharacterized protein DUF3857/uncharacterized protein DUF3858